MKKINAIALGALCIAAPFLTTPYSYVTYAENSISVSPNTPPIRNYMACILTKWAFEYHGKIPVNILLKYFANMDTACNFSTSTATQQEYASSATTSTMQHGSNSSSNSTVSTVISSSQPAQSSSYPMCDTADIVLSNGQTWAACNVGATKAGTGSESYGSYFQWGRNIPITSTGTVSTTFGPLDLSGANATPDFIISQSSNDWLTVSNDNLWGGSSTSYSTGTYSGLTVSDKSLMQGPCASGYHVPTMREWCDAIDTINGTNGCTYSSVTTVNSVLKIPFASDLLSGKPEFLPGISGVYWSSSPSQYGSASVVFSHAAINPIQSMFTYRKLGESVRCIKN